MSRRTVEDWRRAVFASSLPKMTAATKVLCLYLGDHMRADRRVSIPRKDIAAALGCHEQRIADRFRSAVEAGFLVNVLPGCTGRTAVYQGTWPDADCVPLPSTHLTGRERTDSRDALGHAERYTVPTGAERETAEVCTAERYANVEADLSARPTGRDVGSEDKAEENLVRFPTTGCVWHEHSCPDDCAKQPESREASA